MNQSFQIPLSVLIAFFFLCFSLPTTVRADFDNLFDVETTPSKEGKIPDEESTEKKKPHQGSKGLDDTEDEKEEDRKEDEEEKKEERPEEEAKEESEKEEGEDADDNKKADADQGPIRQPGAPSGFEDFGPIASVPRSGGPGSGRVPDAPAIPDNGLGQPGAGADPGLQDNQVPPNDFGRRNRNNRKNNNAQKPNEEQAQAPEQGGGDQGGGGGGGEQPSSGGGGGGSPSPGQPGQPGPRAEIPEMKPVDMPQVPAAPDASQVFAALAQGAGGDLSSFMQVYAGLTEQGQAMRDQFSQSGQAMLAGAMQMMVNASSQYNQVFSAISSFQAASQQAAAYRMASAIPTTSGFNFPPSTGSRTFSSAGGNARLGSRRQAAPPRSSAASSVVGGSTRGKLNVLPVKRRVK